MVRSSAAGLFGQPIGQGLHQTAHVRRLAAQIECRRIGAREYEQIVDEADQAIGFGLNRFQKAIAHFQIVHSPVAQRLDRALDRRQRRAQFVRDIGHEIHLHLARGLQARGHVVEGLAQAAQSHRANGPAPLDRNALAPRLRPQW